MKWLKNFDRLLEIQRNIVWPPVLEMDPKQFYPEFLKAALSRYIDNQTRNCIPRMSSMLFQATMRKVDRVAKKADPN